MQSKETQSFCPHCYYDLPCTKLLGKQQFLTMIKHRSPLNSHRTGRGWLSH